jgi:hypothetical protein
MAYALLLHAGKDGQPRGDYSISLMAFSCGLEFWLLWQGGFWHALGWQ